MSDKQIFKLINNQVKARASHAVLNAMEGYVVRITPPTRSLEMNAKFHAICGDYEKSGILWAGKPRNAQQWKVLLVSGHAVATKEEAEIIPGLEGEFINIRESTAMMSVKRGSSLIEYSLALGMTMGVVFSQ